MQPGNERCGEGICADAGGNAGQPGRNGGQLGHAQHGGAVRYFDAAASARDGLRGDLWRDVRGGLSGHGRGHAADGGRDDPVPAGAV